MGRERWSIGIILGMILILWASAVVASELDNRLAQCDLIYEGHVDAAEKSLACKEKILFEFEESDPGVLFEERVQRCEAAFGNDWLQAKQDECSSEWNRKCNSFHKEVLPIMEKYNGQLIHPFRDSVCYKKNNPFECRDISVADAAGLDGCTNFAGWKSYRILFGRTYDVVFRKNKAYCYLFVQHEASGGTVECKFWGKASTGGTKPPYLVAKRGGKADPNWVHGRNKCEKWAKSEQSKRQAKCRRISAEK